MPLAKYENIANFKKYLEELKTINLEFKVASCLFVFVVALV
jgi:hypothetical protein